MHDHDTPRNDAPSHDASSHDASSPDASRRRFLGRMAAAGISLPFLTAALAQSHQHGNHHGNDGGTLGSTGGGMGRTGGMAGMGMGSTGPVIGPDLLPAADIPWETGTCAFCGMTLATPPQAPFPAGFRERTYAQIRVVDETGGGGDAIHFESLACMANYAYALQLRDGHATTMYVADEGAPQTPAHGLLPAREASFIWAEGLRVSMNARLAAYPNDDAARAAIARLEMPGRHRLLDAVALYDFAPWPEMNLVPLLAQATGLLDE